MVLTKLEQKHIEYMEENFHDELNEYIQGEIDRALTYNDDIWDELRHRVSPLDLLEGKYTMEDFLLELFEEKYNQDDIWFELYNEYLTLEQQREIEAL